MNSKYFSNAVWVCAAMLLSACAGSDAQEQGGEAASASVKDPDAIVLHKTSEDPAASAASETASPESSDADETVATASQALSSTSFTRTCSPWGIDFYADGSIYAEAYCRRRNGSYQWTSWGRGFCNGDLANCDGNLRCGRC